MDDFFTLVTKEFTARSAQIRQLVKAHGPSIGAGHEVLLKRFLRDYLPDWIDVAHGFVRNHEGEVSGQTDVLLYNSLYYAPLYKIDDFVIVQPESVVGCIEVKTTVTKKDFLQAMGRLVALKRLVPDTWIGMFVFHPPSLKVVKRYLDKLKFEQVPDDDIPDFVCGLSKYYLQKENVDVYGHADAGGDNPDTQGIAYVNHVYSTRQHGQDYTFEVFFQNIYRRVETRINKDIKEGIDNVWYGELGSEDEPGILRPHGRLRFSNVAMESAELLSIVKREREHIYGRGPEQEKPSANA